jgi:DNA-binding CsgD family transcriptional regulator
LLRLNREFRVTQGIVIPLRDVFGFTGMLACSFEGTERQLRESWQAQAAAFLEQVRQHHGQILSRYARPLTRDAVPELSARQREIVRLLANGLSTEDVADALRISVHTVNKHVAMLKQSMGAETLAHATALAARWGLI